VEALARLPRHVRLAVAGDPVGEPARAARRLADEHGLAERIDWLGFVTPERRTSFLDSIDLLAMPSTFESFGMAAAEAMRSGVPVLVSDRTGVAELIGRRGGGVVVAAHPDRVAAAIRELDHDRPRLSRLGAEAQAAVCEELSYDRVGGALRDAYERSAGAR